MATLLEQVTLPEGKRGPWTVRRFEVSKHEAMIGSIRAMQHGRGSISPGIYTQLRHERRGIIMSDTPDEMRDHYEPVIQAKGHVLLNGLGLGMVLQAILKRKDVFQVTVVEIDEDVIALCGAHYTKDKRVKIIKADAFKFQPPKGVRYDVVWHDIWDNLCEDNLLAVTKLKRKYGRRCDWQGCWGENYLRRFMR